MRGRILIVQHDAQAVRYGSAPACQPDHPTACARDGQPCYIGGDEPHWRCGTSACHLHDKDRK